MNLADDYLLEKATQRRANMQLAMFAIHLAAGNTLYHKQVKSGTIATYLRNVAYLIKPLRGNDPRYVDPTDRALAPCIRGVLDPLKKWEGLPNRRETFTTGMLDHTIAKASKTHVDGIESALADHFTTGLYAGYRCSEWAQSDKSNHAIGTHLLKR